MFNRIVLVGALGLGLPCWGQWAASASGSSVAAAEINGKINWRAGSVAPTALACTAGKDWYFDTTGIIAYWCSATGSPGTWTSDGLLNAPYVTTTAVSGLSAEVNLGALATGFVKGTISGGVSTLSSQAPSAFSVIASGTAATIGTSAPSIPLDFGTQDPTFTLTGAGGLQYWLVYHVRPNLAAATFSANATVTCWAARTNNTPVTVANTTRAALVPVATTQTVELSTISMSTQYTSSGTNDVIELRCQLSSAAGAGSVTALGASVEALGMFQ